MIKTSCLSLKFSKLVHFEFSMVFILFNHFIQIQILKFNSQCCLIYFSISPSSNSQVCSKRINSTKLYLQDNWPEALDLKIWPSYLSTFKSSWLSPSPLDWPRPSLHKLDGNDGIEDCLIEFFLMTIEE